MDKIIAAKSETMARVYPDKLLVKRAELLQGFSDEKKCPNIRRRLELIVDGFKLLAETSKFESDMKLRALAVVMKRRAGLGRRITDGKMGDL